MTEIEAIDREIIRRTIEKVGEDSVLLIPIPFGEKETTDYEYTFNPFSVRCQCGKTFLSFDDFQNHLLGGNSNASN